MVDTTISAMKSTSATIKSQERSVQVIKMQHEQEQAVVNLMEQGLKAQGEVKAAPGAGRGQNLDISV